MRWAGGLGGGSCGVVGRGLFVCGCVVGGCTWGGGWVVCSVVGVGWGLVWGLGGFIYSFM